MIPVFQTNYSIGKGILTLDPPVEIDGGPTSVFSIAKKHGLTEINVADYNFAGFPTFYKGCLKEGFKPRFGIKFYVCQNCTDKSDESLRSESKVVVWMLNSAAYQDLCRLYSVSYEEQNFYYQNRLDWPQLKSLWTPNLGLSIDYYDGFLAQNLLRNGCCVPDLSFTEPVFHLCGAELPFDSLIREKTVSFCAENNYKTLETSPVYYFADSDAETFQTFRAIQNKATLQKPNLDHFSSNKFSFEEYLRLTKT